MGKANFDDDFKRDAVARITELGSLRLAPVKPSVFRRFAGADVTLNFLAGRGGSRLDG
ncbi:MAG: hypothetical protein WAU86_14190 [Oricola sp.]